jgi:hypothetical protein
MSTIKYLYTFEMDEKISDCFTCPLLVGDEGYCSLNDKIDIWCENHDRPLDCPLDEMEMEMDESEGDI